MATKLSLRIHKVKCVDETGGAFAERVGNDEIYLGGFAVINQAGETIKIDPVSIYPDFDDGDVKVFSPAKLFHTINLSAGEAYPRTYALGLVLVERDRGGMVEAVKKITDFFEAKLKEKLAQPRPAGLLPVAVGVLLKQAIIIIAPTVLSYVRNTIVQAFADEIFTPKVAMIELPTKDFTFPGGNSPDETVEFRDHGGIYQLTYDWVLS